MIDLTFSQTTMTMTTTMTTTMVGPHLNDQTLLTHVQPIDDDDGEFA